MVLDADLFFNVFSCIPCSHFPLVRFLVTVCFLWDFVPLPVLSSPYSLFSVIPFLIYCNGNLSLVPCNFTSLSSLCSIHFSCVLSPSFVHFPWFTSRVCLKPQFVLALLLSHTVLCISSSVCDFSVVSFFRGVYNV